MLAFAGLLAAAGTGSDAPTGPPAAPPSAVSLSYWGGDRIRVTWTNGDATAATHVGLSEDTGEPDSVFATAPAGGTTYETPAHGTIAADDGSGAYWWCRHTKNGSVTAWVRCSGMVESLTF